MEELDLKELLKVMKSKNKIMLIILVAFLIVGCVYSFKFVTPKYKSSTSLILGKNENAELTQKSKKTDEEASITQSDVTLNQKLVGTYSELLKTNGILSKVKENLNLDEDVSIIASNVSITSVNDTEVIKISVVNNDPEKAQKIALEITKVFSEKVQEIYKINNVTIVDDAKLPTEPYNVNHLKDLAIFGFAGLVVAVAYVLVFNFFDDTIKSAEDIEKNTDLVVLATIPDCTKIKSKNRYQKKY